jgi:cytochrome c553
MFREHMRGADPMNDMAKGLSDDDLRKFAETIAKLPAPRPPDGPLDAARIERARALVAQNRYNICHTATFAGQDNVPNIADQREDYLVKTLRGYKDNSRHGYDATHGRGHGADQRRSDFGSRLLHRAGRGAVMLDAP